MIDLVREQQQSTLDDRSADVRGTNKSKNKGLISADRRTKPTLMLTIPRSEQSRLQWIYLFQRLKLRWSTMLSPEAYRDARHIGRGEYRRFPAWILT